MPGTSVEDIEDRLAIDEDGIIEIEFDALVKGTLIPYTVPRARVRTESSKREERVGDA